MDLLHFLETLYQDADSYIYSWSAQDKKSNWYHTTELNRMAGESSGEVDLYFGVGFLDREGNATTRAKTNDISGVPGFWIDIDILDPGAHKLNNLPPDLSAAINILKPEPTIIVHSGYGVHAYWLFHDPWIFQSENERNEAAAMLKSLQSTIRSDSGFNIDPTHDLARILRLPETGNGKKSPAVPVKIIKSDGPRYSRNDFQTSGPIIRQSERTDNFKRNPDDGTADLVINNCAFIQYCKEHANILPEPHWQAMLSNISRCADGVQAVHELSAPYPKYDFNETNTKIKHVLNDMHPTTCKYIQDTLGFQGCPSGGCAGVKSPCVWALGKLPRSKAVIKNINIDNAFDEEIIGALAIIRQSDPQEFTKVTKPYLQKQKIPLREINQAIRNYLNPNLRVVEPGDKQTVSQSLPDAPIDLIIPNEWILAKTGLKYTDFTKINPLPVTVSHMPILVTGRMYNITTETEKLTISYERGNKWRSLSLPRSQALNARKLPDAADSGLPVTSENSRLLVKWFSDLDGTNDLPLIKSVAHMGWHASDVFFPGAENNYVLDMDDGGEVQNAFHTRGEFDEWKNTAMEVRKHTLARLFLSCSFAAPLLKILDQRTFMAYIWGNSAGGKTAALIFAMSVWGAPDKLMISFNGTHVGIERRVGYTPDLPLGINERQSVGAGRDKQEWLESLVYLLGEEKGRTRGSRTGLQRTASWRTIALGTGEQPISTESSAQGVKTRVLEIAGEPISDDKLASSLHTVARKNCGHAGPLFIQELINQDKNKLRGYANDFKDYLKNSYPEHFHVHIDAVVSICIADYYSSMWIFDLSDEDAKKEAMDLAHEVMRNLPTQKEISDVDRGWDFVINWLDMNDARIIGENSEAKLTPSYGFVKDGKTHIYPEILRSAMQEAGFSYDKMLREFAKKNKIETSIEGNRIRNTVKVRDPEKWKDTPRMIILKN